MRSCFNDPSTKDIELISVLEDEELAESYSNNDTSDMRDVLLTCARYQQRLRPNKWTNDVIRKLKKANVNNLHTLFMLLKSNTLNIRMKSSGVSPFHHPTIKVLSCAQDYLQLMENKTLVEYAIRDDYAGYPLNDDYPSGEDF